MKAIFIRTRIYSFNVIHSPYAIRCSRTTCKAFNETDLTSKLLYRRDDLQLEKYARFSERLPGISLQKAVRTICLMSLVTLPGQRLENFTPELCASGSV